MGVRLCKCLCVCGRTTMPTVDVRPTATARDDDPYPYPGEIDGARARRYVEQQTTATLARFGGAKFEYDRDVLAAIYDRPDNIPFVTRRGPHLFNVWKDARNPRGLWRRTTLASFRAREPEWDV